MAHEAIPTDASTMPEVSRLVREVTRTGRARLLQVDGEAALLSPAQPPRQTEPVRAGQSRPEHAPRPRRPRRKTGILTADDPLMRLIGIGASGIPGGVSGKKHEYLARAYRPK